jgi:hypothetical protein
VDDERYLWKVEHAHDEPRRCVEVFTAFLEGRKASPLRVRFVESGDHHAGYPEAGSVWTSTEPKRYANLNTPRIAVALVRAGRKTGWAPETAKTPLVMDGFAWLLATVTGPTTP